MLLVVCQFRYSIRVSMHSYKSRCRYSLDSGVGHFMTGFDAVNPDGDSTSQSRYTCILGAGRICLGSIQVLMLSFISVEYRDIPPSRATKNHLTLIH